MSLAKQPSDPAEVIAPDHSALRTPHSALAWALLLLPLGYLWFRLIANLQVEWETNPQYSYGYIVPFLCLGLLFHRWQAIRAQPSTVKPQLLDGPSSMVRGPASIFHLPSSIFFFLFASLAFLYLPTRLIELATPEWRPIQWSLGVITIGLSLITVGLVWGRRCLRICAFPICLFFVAIPWPTLLEQPIIQFLTRVNASLVIEVMGFLGIPALQHGNVIEVSTGVVGIDEACSGIRSFQSSIMISLFLGALYDLTLLRRLLFVPIGFGLAMVFNLFRTSFLTWIAAKQGVAAIEKYHDPAGLWILVGCTVGMWLLGLLLKKRVPQPSAALPPEAAIVAAVSASNFKLPTSIRRCSAGLLVWLVLVEAGSQFWYKSREAKLPQAVEWALAFPTNNPTLKDLPMASKTFDLLRFDDGKQASWTESDGTQWSAFYFNWKPGRVAGYLAKRHTPEICMPATGRQMLSGPELLVLKIHGLDLPVRRYRFGPDGNSLHVYHCRWEAGATPDSFVTQESARYNLIRAIWNGRGNQGQKIIEFIISGTEDAEAAKAMLVQRLEEMIKVEGAPEG